MEKLSHVSVQNENFAEKTFVDLSGPIIMWVWSQNFAEKPFTDGSETTKTRMCPPLKVFRHTVYIL